MKTATEIQLEALAMAYDSLRLYTEDMTQDEYESDTKREWVDLTDDDIQSILKEWSQAQMTVREMLLETEAKLKEKNT